MSNSSLYVSSEVNEKLTNLVNGTGVTVNDLLKELLNINSIADRIDKNYTRKEELENYWNGFTD